MPSGWLDDVVGPFLGVDLAAVDDRSTGNGLPPVNTTTTYDVNGAMTSLVYPSGNTVSYVNNGAGQEYSAADSANNYAGAALYAPQGALCALENGGYIISSLVYNNRLQPGRISASSSGSAPSSCPTSISGTGSVLDLSYNFNLGAGDNGNVMGITNNRNTARSETFTYDALNRVSTAWSNGNLWGETYSIDPWGNLNQFGPYENSQNQILPFVEASQSLAANTQNQVSAFCYDTAGNVLAEAGSQCPPAQGSGFTYNAENQLTFAGGTNYVYDGDGNRVEKYMLNTQNQIVFQELYWYGGGSTSLDETDGTGSTTDSAFNEYVFFDGARTARRNTGGVYYYFADHLGTSREIVQSGSTTPCYDADFTPYGVEMPNTNTCAQNYKFTGKERDTESGLDNFGARYDSSSLGRFMSPDWSVKVTPVPYAKLSNPQSLNLYAYVGNNPMTRFDPDGHFDCTGKNAQGVGCQYIAYWNALHGISPSAKKSDAPGVPVRLPNGQTVPDPHSPTGKMMAPSSSVSEVAAAAQKTKNVVDDLAEMGLLPVAAGVLADSLATNVGTGGNFDDQRMGPQSDDLTGGFQELPQFRDASNFNVGLFSQQVGMTLDQTLQVAGNFAKHFSSDYSPDQPYGLSPQTAEFIRAGYQAGETAF
jgi:RHS repeat-associated protein